MSGDRERWRQAGMDDAARVSFQEWKISLADAVVWRSVGVPDGLTALRWSLAGVAPQQVAQWRAAGIESVEALQWHQHNYDLAAAVHEKSQGNNPSSAGVRAAPSSGRTRRSVSMSYGTGLRGGMQMGTAFRDWFEQAGHPSQEAHLYLVEGWVSDDALPWARAGIAPEAARMWLVLGVRPAEAAGLHKAGMTVSRVTQDWWTAGVPLDQVAAWLGAGFTAVEARQQIAAGVDPERAAVLRALREGTDD